MVALNGSVTTIEQSLLENTSHPRFAMRKVRPSASRTELGCELEEAHR